MEIKKFEQAQFIVAQVKKINPGASVELTQSCDKFYLKVCFVLEDDGKRN